MKQYLTLVATFAVLTAQASGANVAVSGSSTTILAGASGGAMTLGVTSDDPAPPATENLAAWQLRLIVVPDGGATGTVSFSTVLPPTPYLLNGANFGINSNITTTTTTNDSLLAFDLNFPFSGGVPVPVAPGAGLAEITFSASAGATGTFGLFAIPGAGNSEWSDNSGGGPAVREYSNLPSVGAPPPNVRIGEITIIPEPASGTLAFFGLSLVFLRRRR